MSVETAVASRHDVVDYVTVVGNLIGEATVDVVPRAAGRLESIAVKLGDRVSRGQVIAKVEDREIREQVNQSEANIEVNRATVNSRENDLKVAKNALERAQTSFERQILSRQALEDAEARYNSAVSQVTVAKAQLASTQARLDELKVNLGNTQLVAPMDGVVSRRLLDPGGVAGGNTVVLSIVNIGTVRLVANLVEKDFRRVQPGAEAIVEVDAFPGEQFTGQVSRVAPVFDPATRTATMEIEVPNPGYRLKPGMYARVRLTAEKRANSLTVPRDAVVDVDGKHGLFVVDGDTARFRALRTGISDGERVEVLDNLEDGTRVVTIGALAIRDGDRIITSGGGRGGRGRSGQPGGAPATAASATGGAPGGATGARTDGGQSNGDGARSFGEGRRGRRGGATPPAQ
jgi:RND family efflux transporter MFP subunit